MNDQPPEDQDGQHEARIDSMAELVKLFCGTDPKAGDVIGQQAGEGRPDQRKDGGKKIARMQVRRPAMAQSHEERERHENRRDKIGERKVQPEHLAERRHLDHGHFGGEQTAGGEQRDQRQAQKTGHAVRSKVPVVDRVTLADNEEHPQGCGHAVQVMRKRCLGKDHEIARPERRERNDQKGQDPVVRAGKGQHGGFLGWLTTLAGQHLAARSASRHDRQRPDVR